MSTINVTTAAETPPQDPGPVQPQSPTTTAYQQVADQFMRQLDILAVIIPRQEVTKLSSKRHVRGHLNVNRRFLEVVVSSVEQDPHIKAHGQLDSVAARDGMQYLDAFGPVLAKMEADAARLRFSLQAVKASLVVSTQQTYDISKGLARDPNKPEVAKRVAQMGEALGLRGRRPLAEEPQPPGGPTPPAKTVVARRRRRAAR